MNPFEVLEHQRKPKRKGKGILCADGSSKWADFQLSKPTLHHQKGHKALVVQTPESRPQSIRVPLFLG